MLQCAWTTLSNTTVLEISQHCSLLLSQSQLTKLRDANVKNPAHSSSVAGLCISVVSKLEHPLGLGLCATAKGYVQSHLCSSGDFDFQDSFFPRVTNNEN
jgi:hypothetical protein